MFVRERNFKRKKRRRKREKSEKKVLWVEKWCKVRDSLKKKKQARFELKILCFLRVSGSTHFRKFRGSSMRFSGVEKS